MARRRTISLIAPGTPPSGVCTCHDARVHAQAVCGTGTSSAYTSHGKKKLRFGRVVVLRWRLRLTNSSAMVTRAPGRIVDPLSHRALVGNTRTHSSCPAAGCPASGGKRTLIDRWHSSDLLSKLAAMSRTLWAQQCGAHVFSTQRCRFSRSKHSSRSYALFVPSPGHVTR